jgi:hypothetical protein
MSKKKIKELSAEEMKARRKEYTIKRKIKRNAPLIDKCNQIARLISGVEGNVYKGKDDLSIIKIKCELFDFLYEIKIN